MGNIRGQFGIFSGAQSEANGVTSVTAGTGLTGGTITSTGTITRDPNTDLDGEAGPVENLSSSGRVQAYDLETFPPTDAVYTNNNRTGVISSPTPTTDRIGFNGIATYDEISLSGVLTTNCSSGALAYSEQFGGIFDNRTVTFTPAVIVCNGTTQTTTFSIPTFRVGDNGICPTSPNTDYIQIGFAYSGSGGTTGFQSIDFSVNTFTDA